MGARQASTIGHQVDGRPPAPDVSPAPVGSIPHRRQVDGRADPARADDNFEMHNNSEWIFTRYRLLRINGTARNQIHW